MDKLTVGCNRRPPIELVSMRLNRECNRAPTLVWSKSGIVLNAVAPVHLSLALVILPDNAELYNTFGNLDNVECLLVRGILLEEVFQGCGDLSECLETVSDLPGL
jgi:hypothetical protein